MIAVAEPAPAPLDDLIAEALDFDEDDPDDALSFFDLNDGEDWGWEP